MPTSPSRTSPARVDTVLEVLSRRHRRRLLYYLREHGSATRSELVDLLTGWATTNDHGVTTGPPDRQRMAITFAHVLLPKLQESGLVRYDPDTDVVQLSTVPLWVDRCLDVTFSAEVGAVEKSERLLAQRSGGRR